MNKINTWPCFTGVCFSLFALILIINLHQFLIYAPHFWFNALWLVCLHLWLLPPAGSITFDACTLFCRNTTRVYNIAPVYCKAADTMKGAEYTKMGNLINIKVNYCIYIYKHLTLIQEQKCEADLANNISHLNKTTVGTPRHMHHHSNTDYMLTRVKLTVTDTGLNYSFSYATEWRLSVLRFKFSAIYSHREW